ncbi:MAG: keto-hydroxyglutarate-aldolase/keto-deoxy-phosphogluconate aldolase, partial [Lachnospiraceae bacterium]|nr:keto-hydroxyglutarate-aldolase/keto-deoxy-phosphogluconate aldolase [Lachnospiraceae bacterium]
GKGVEVMKSNGRGEKGHIAISTKSVDRAVYHLEKQGIEFDYSTAKTDEKTGRMKVIYLKESFGGFAVHLLQEA